MSTPAPPPRSSRGNPALGDIVRSVVVLGVIVLGLYLVGRVLFTETPDRPMGDVDYVPVVESARRGADFDLLAPRSLPDGWVANSARFDPDGGGRWHLGVVTSDDEYIGLDQSTVSEERAIKRWADGSEPAGSAQVAGRVWQVRTGPGERITYVSTDGGVTTVINGTADQPVIDRYVSSLSDAS